MDIPFLRTRHSFTDASTLILLPSPYATVLNSFQKVSVYGPHSKVWVVPAENDDSILFLRPNFIKDILGHPKHFVDRVYSQQELPLLSPFLSVQSKEGYEALLKDARDAVDMTHNELQFENIWGELIDGVGNLLIT